MPKSSSANIQYRYFHDGDTFVFAGEGIKPLRDADLFALIAKVGACKLGHESLYTKKSSKKDGGRDV